MEYLLSPTRFPDQTNETMTGTAQPFLPVEYPFRDIREFSAPQSATAGSQSALIQVAGDYRRISL